MNDRLRSIVDQLSIGPDDLVLEIGCGHGVAASLVCERLKRGHYTAIDRSGRMIEAARRRNAFHIASGRADFLSVSLEDADLGSWRFEKIFAVRVGLFARSPSGRASLPKDGLLPVGSSSHVSILHKPVTRPAIRDMSRRHENTSLAAPASGTEDDRAR